MVTPAGTVPIMCIKPQQTAEMNASYCVPSDEDRAHKLCPQQQTSTSFKSTLQQFSEYVCCVKEREHGGRGGQSDVGGGRELHGPHPLPQHAEVSASC